MKFTTFKQANDFLLQQLPNFSDKTYPIDDFKLNTILKFCAHLNQPQQKIKTVHVAGTNGKGSVSNMLSAVLTHHGYKTGLFSSPHIYKLNERIKINGKDISNNFIIHFLNTHFNLIRQLKPSFFEIITIIAFEYFYQRKVDIAIIEVGLGGRLDSTNIINPLLSVITNISLDHTQWLGNTLNQIAKEKAGIIKPDTPVVIGQFHSATYPVFKKIAKQHKAPLFLAEQFYKTRSIQQTFKTLKIEVQNRENKKYKKYILDLNGIYQQHNLICVLQSLEVLNSFNLFKLSDKKIIAALKQVKNINHFCGRWDTLKNKPLVIADVAHNEGGFKYILDFITKNKNQQLRIIIGRVKDKAQHNILKLLPQKATYYFTQMKNFRSLTSQALLEEAQKYKLKGVAFSNVNQALAQALKDAHPKDIILICGSIFMYAEIKKHKI